MSILDFEDRVEHALFRGAWESLHLYSAFGSKKKNGESLTLDDFYGQEIAVIREHTGQRAAEISPEAQAKLERANAAIFEARMRRDHPDSVVGDPPDQPEAAPE